MTRGPSLPLHPLLGLGMILRLAHGVVNHTTHGLHLLLLFLRRFSAVPAFERENYHRSLKFAVLHKRQQ